MISDREFKDALDQINAAFNSLRAELKEVKDFLAPKETKKKT